MDSDVRNILFLEMENARLCGEILSRTSNLLAILSKTIAAKDRATKLHSVRVTKYSMMIGRQLGLPEEEMELVYQGALLHDLGKIGISDNVLLKPDKLTLTEFETIQDHPKIGARILQAAPQFKAIVPTVLYHHERFDGRGYPNGLREVEIPLHARIICVSDSFEAMTASRPYRKAVSVEYAIDELRLHSGTQFDPEIVQAFIDAMKNNKFKRSLTRGCLENRLRKRYNL